MKNTLIDQSAHGILLLLLDELPFDEAFVLRQELQETYTEYLEQLGRLQDMVGAYDSIATKVRVKSSVRKRKLKSNEIESIIS